MHCKWGKSVVHYVIDSTILFDHVSDFYISEEDFYDHFPVCCPLSFETTDNTVTRATENLSNLRSWHTYKWKDTCRDLFLNQFIQLYTEFSSTVTVDSVTEKLLEFSSLYK